MKPIAWMRSLLISLILISNTAWTAESFTIDPNHTAVLWHIDHFGFSKPSGKWYANGQLVLDESTPQNSKVNITIQVGELVTGIPELDKHLKGKQFFEITRFPTATFVSDKVEVTGKDSANVQGKLDVRGISKPVTLQVKLNKVGENPINNKKTVGFTASTTLKRSDFGMTTLLPGLGDEVQIDIEAEAFKD
ncbi:MAG: YceI family protein [Gammaproteobacteria bacterium]